MRNVVIITYYTLVFTKQCTMDRLFPFRPKNSQKVYTPHINNLIVNLNIVNSILKWVLIDPTDVYLLYIKAFKEMELHSSMLTYQI